MLMTVLNTKPIKLVQLHFLFLVIGSNLNMFDPSFEKYSPFSLYDLKAKTIFHTIQNTKDPNENIKAAGNPRVAI